MSIITGLIKNVKKFGLEYIGLYYSNYPGFVADNLDPKNQNRLSVLVPTIFGYPSRPIWVYPKASAPNIHNLPKVGQTVLVEFNHGLLDSGLWSYSAPLVNEKPEEFRTDKVYGFKTNDGHLVMIDEIDNEISITHKDGQKVLITEDNIQITSDDIRLTQEDVEEQSPLGNSLDEDLHETFSLLKDLIEQLDIFTTTQADAATGAMLPLAIGYATLKGTLVALKVNINKSLNKYQDKSHLSNKVKLS